MCQVYRVIIYLFISTLLFSSDVIENKEFIPDVKLKDINKKKLRISSDFEKTVGRNIYEKKKQ